MTVRSRLVSASAMADRVGVSAEQGQEKRARASAVPPISYSAFGLVGHGGRGAGGVVRDLADLVERWVRAKTEDVSVA